MMVNGDCVSSFLITALLITVGSPESLGSEQRQVGVFLKLHGATIPNNSLVDIDDLLYTGKCCEEPSNARPELHDQALLCVTDLEDCCESPHAVRGDWHYPDGRTVQYDVWGSTFRRNRGANEVRDGRQFYGSVRLYRRYNRPPERGRFSCELPNAADPSVNQTLYANILDFGPVSIPSSGFNMAGESYSLMCSATLFDPIPLPSDVPLPTFEWLFGPNDNVSNSLPSGVTPMVTSSSSSINSTSITYTSALQFSPLSQSHGGLYTCQLGAGRLVNTAMIIVNEPAISAQITLASLLGGYSIVCNVNGAENLKPSIISYHWTKNNGTHIQMPVESDPRVPSLLLFRLSDVGLYTCQATVSSPYLLDNITMIATQHITIQIPSPISVMISSNILDPMRPVGSAVTLICTVEYSPAVTVDIPVTINTVWTGPAGFMATNVAVRIDATTYVSLMFINSFGIEQFGNYTCMVTVSSKYANSFLSDSNSQSGTTWVGTVDQHLAPMMSCTCFKEVGIAVGVLILMEGIIAIIIVVVCKYRFIKRKKSGKDDVTLSMNIAYDEVKLGTIGGGWGGSEYEDPYTQTRSAHRQENCVPCSMDNESSVSKLEAPVYATVDQ